MAQGERISGDERLLLEVVEALRGADNLRDRLLTVLQSGTPAVADLAYAIKARVKEDYKIIEKIKDRRTGNANRDPQPAYGIENVTDLVGLRIVTLYRLDVIEVIEALLATIKGDMSPSAPFVPDSISEVTIYSTNPTGDVQGLPQRLLDLFGGHQLSAVTKIAEKPSNYSSIHILVRGRGKYREGYRDVPVEIQVRTALEDVWGQIEHTLKYKRKLLTGTGAPSRESARLSTTLSHLGALKTMIDGIAQYADQIKLQIDELEPDLLYSESKPTEEASARLAKLKDLPSNIRDEITAAVAMAKPALSDSGEPAPARISVLRTALARFEALGDLQSELTTTNPKTRREAVYIVVMQRALIHFQLGNLLEHGESQLQKALRLYREMESRFPKRLVVSYRLGRTLDALGARSEAISKLREVVERLAVTSEPTPKDHWIRSAAPRVLGVLLWEEAKARQDALAGHPCDSIVLELLKEAYALNLTAHDTQVFNDPMWAASATERVKAANNLLYFLLEYFEAGGEPGDKMRKEDVSRYLEEIGGNRPGELRSLNLADTSRRAHGYLRDQDRELESAKAVVRIAAQAPQHRTQVVRDAIRAAERTLEAATTTKET